MRESEGFKNPRAKRKRRSRSPIPRWDLSRSEGAHHRPLQTPPRWLEGARAYGSGPERW